jgi:hypothetical protein
LEAEGASQHVLGQTLPAGAVVRSEPHREVHVEAGVLPAEHLGDERLVDLAAHQKQVEDLLLPEPLERLGVELRQRNERAVGGKGPVGGQGMDMGMKMDELTEGMDARHHARTDVAPIQHRAGDLQDRLPGETRKLAQQPPVVAEEDPQTLGRLGIVKTNWRWATAPQTSRAMWWAITSARFWWQLGHRHRRRHEKATKNS